MNKYQDSRVREYLYEWLFSLNVSLVLVAFVFNVGPSSLRNGLTHFEFTMDKLTQSRITDYSRGYWEFFVPAVALALVLSLALRLFHRTRFGLSILGLPAGIGGMALAPAWLFVVCLRTQGLRGLEIAQLCELLAAIVCTIFYWQNRYSVPLFIGLTVLALHYSFWFWQFYPFFVSLSNGWGGAVGIASIIGFSSALAWIFYLRRLDSALTRAETAIST